MENKQNGFSLVILLFFLILVFIISTGYILVYKQKATVEQPFEKMKESVQSNNDATVDTVQSIDTYTNVDHGIKFNNAGWELLSEERLTTQFTAKFKSLNSLDSFSFVIEEKSKETLPPFLSTNSTKSINGLKWYIFDSNGEYCDAGECGKTASSIYTFNGPYMYRIYYSTDIKEQLEDIAATFEFLN